ncbi:hypothetical protein [Streptomyces cacaoi]|uniref:Uncharacterized protein n=1 Tax=Streptomyces cacaoi TaxID=1898 RepID=A0A4Y3R0K0_STRCI|nr:hypothetical protein [Streptomyces cacaoi]GEB50447.1 hypothetical protein SCA03_29980 [Streptomyces cacaoi]
MKGITLSIQLTFDDLLNEATTAPGVEFTDAHGEVITIRPFESLPGADFKLVLKYIDILQDDKTKESSKIETMDACLVTACDKRTAMQEALDSLPLKSREAIFNAWMETAQVPES